MLIDLNGVYVEPSLVAVVRPSTLDDSQTVIFTAGQSAVDSGYLIDMDIEDVIEAVNASQMQAMAEGLLADVESDPAAAR
jgi:hypothetical protein